MPSGALRVEDMNPEQMVTVAEGVELCVQTVGDPHDPAILLIHGACASMVWWEEELCERIAAGGRFVIRYDQRDVGRSSTFPLGDPGYAMSDLAADAVGILDALGLERAHVLGRSMSGGTALFLAVDHPERVASVTFMSTTTNDDGLPSPTAEFGVATDVEAPDPSDTEAFVEYATTMVMAYHGTSPLADVEHVRRLARLDVARTRDLAASPDEPLRDGLRQPAGRRVRRRRATRARRPRRPRPVLPGRARRGPARGGPRRDPRRPRGRGPRAPGRPVAGVRRGPPGAHGPTTQGVAR